MRIQIFLKFEKSVIMNNLMSGTIRKASIVLGLTFIISILAKGPRLKI